MLIEHLLGLELESGGCEYVSEICEIGFESKVGRYEVVLVTYTSAGAVPG